VAEPVAAAEWDRLADLQRLLRSLDSEGDVSGVPESVGRGVRLHVLRMAVEEVIRRDRDRRARRRRDEFERALDGFLERAARRAQAGPPLLALPVPVVPSAPSRRKAVVASPVPAAAAAPAASKATRLRKAGPARRRVSGPVPEFWSPRPVLGFRFWDMRGRLHGAWRAWDHPCREARCITGRTERDDGDVPHTDGRCGHPPCGIYAFKEPAQLLGAFELPEGSRRYVYGLVALSGKVVEHERGYRARRAAVVAAVVVGRGRLVRVEGLERLQNLFAAPEDVVVGLIASDPTVVEEVGDPVTAAEAVVAYLALARDFYELTSC
jgi:hypothetical protein